MNNKIKKVRKFHKPYILQFYGYLVFIPFYFSFSSLKDNYNTVDFVIYIIGLLFVLSILLINHLEPVIRVTDKKVLLYNRFHNRPTTLLIKDFNSYKIINKRLIIIMFNNTKYEVKLNIVDMKKFITFLEDIN